MTHSFKAYRHPPQKRGPGQAPERWDLDSRLHGNDKQLDEIHRIVSGRTLRQFEREFISSRIHSCFTCFIRSRSGALKVLQQQSSPDATGWVNIQCDYGNRVGAGQCLMFEFRLLDPSGLLSLRAGNGSSCPYSDIPIGHANDAELTWSLLNDRSFLAASFLRRSNHLPVDQFVIIWMASAAISTVSRLPMSIFIARACGPSK
jgi:hypothetical protein